ncbi:TetR/AcrR family transcriptional regulator [Kocuria tytonicola]|uniref:TetR/AcrR family transcriptional regulator n=1 Tax=Kocuria tytonicola TaxID=2055946 RepID=A0A3L9LWK6_9MICC|nr:TetR/AcrR family transcriptional regulator [Kocuria tytonicola]RLY95143.1 TetR/AcrR family transcriptional regulator [Kocuria tytonicola]RLZ02957.1 TetR/AcrR family transcriptional regulator [Kocuria tytonicola]
MDRRIERTRAAVVEAAVTLVSSRGSQVGMTEIADAAGVSRKAVYENFGSRDQVLRSATESLLARVPRRSPAPDGHHPTPWDVVLLPIAEHIEAFRDYYRSVLSGPGCFTVRDAVVEHAVTGLRNARAQHGPSVDPEAGACDRFIVHGLVGVVADTLVQHREANLREFVSSLTAGLAGTTPSH